MLSIGVPVGDRSDGWVKGYLGWSSNIQLTPLGER